jgi:acyl dehydratase
MGKYYEDLTVGDKFVTAARTIFEYDVAAFSGLSGDYNPIHTNLEFGKASNFGANIAHGALGLSVATGLISRTGIFDGTAVAFLSIDNWTFAGPILINDTIHAEFQITFMRETKNPATGIITRHVRLINQHGDAVQFGDMTLMLKRRPSEGV